MDEAKCDDNQVSRQEDSTSTTTSSCDICAKIVDLFRVSTPEGVYIIGSYQNVMECEGCDLHRPIFRSFTFEYNEFRGTENMILTGRKTAREIYFESNPMKPVEVRIFPDFSIIFRPGHTQMIKAVRSVDESWIDRSLFRFWKQTCDGGNICNRDRAAGSVLAQTSCRPSWLIDTKRLCIVPAPVDVSYVALSYVWGKKPFFKTLQAQLPQLMSKYSLHKARQQLGVPRTITDAIAAVALLDEQYLWVDALCIVQDDEEARNAELKKMAFIYAAASVTIIACQGDNANYGLRGLRQISRPRHFKTQKVFKLDRGYEIVERPLTWRMPSPWHKRGWTYQEELFSRRRLIFDDDCVRWECRCSTVTESDCNANVPKEPYASVSHLDSGFFNPSFPDLYRLAVLFSEYNQRDLTYPQDVVSAFAGIMTTLLPSFPGGFLCGLPLMFFDIALCWESGGCLRERRIPSDQRHPSEAGLPSWSWLGWKCYPNPSCWVLGYEYIKRAPHVYAGPTCEVILSIVQWYVRTWKGGSLIPVYAPQHALRDMKLSTLQGNGEPPPGWRRHDYIVSSKADQSVPWISCYKPKSYFTHESDTNSEFWYPIPSKFDNQNQFPHIHADYTVLCGRTQRAWLYLERSYDEFTEEHYVSIRDESGAWVGALHLSPRLEYDLSITYEGQEAESNMKMRVELVVISEGYAIEGFPAFSIREWYRDQRPRKGEGEKYEYYNVLWVDWVDGIAYRKFLGRVMKSAWDAQDCEWFDLVLG